MEPIESICSQLGSSDQIESYKAFRTLSDLAAKAGAPGNKEDRALLAKTFAAELNAMREIKIEEDDDKDRKKKKKQQVRKEIKHNEKARNQIARLLALVGGKEEVPALKKSLDDLGVREMARWSLDRIQCPEATAALIESLRDDVGREFRVGVVNALGRKTGDGVTEALKKCATDRDGHVRVAAGEALANLPDEANDKPIARLAKRMRGRSRQRLVKARLRLAENLVRAGDAAAGKRIYQAVLADDPAPHQQKAAQSALGQLG